MTETHQKVELEEDYQTACVVVLLAYTNWVLVVHGLWLLRARCKS